MPDFALHVGPSPATGFQFNTGFNNVYTGSNSGINLLQNLERLQSLTDGFTQDRTVINQLGQLSFVSREITTPATVNLGGNYYVADLSNERILGFYVSGDQQALTSILDQSQATKNYFISIAPPGRNNIGWTGQRQVKLISNGQLASWSTEGAVGNIPTTTFAIQGLNYASYTGSVNQELLAIDIGNNGEYVPNKRFTIPVTTSGIAPTVAALRPSDISLDISSAPFGVSVSDLKAQSYSISFDLNVQPLTQLGSLFPYAIEPQFPVTLSASATFYLGDLATGSYKEVICNDRPYNWRIQLNDPCGAGEAVAYEVKGLKVDSQTADQQDVSSIAALLTINASTQLGTATDVNGLYMSGRNI